MLLLVSKCKMAEAKAASSDDEEGYTLADQHRISDLFPRYICQSELTVVTRTSCRQIKLIKLCNRDLTSVFGTNAQTRAQLDAHNHPLAVAGSEARSELTLERMQVTLTPCLRSVGNSK